MLRERAQAYAMSDWRRGFHFSGANDVSAWSADGSRLLNLRVNQLPHNIAPTDSAIVGYIPFTTGAPWLPFVCLLQRRPSLSVS